MHHAFDYYPTFENVIVAHYEGHAIIERCDTDSSDWMITGIELESLIEVDTTVSLPPESAKCQEIADWLLVHKRREISDAWDQYVKEQRADREAA